MIIRKSVTLRRFERVWVFPVVFPAKAGNRFSEDSRRSLQAWIPAFARMTKEHRAKTFQRPGGYPPGIRVGWVAIALAGALTGCGKEQEAATPDIRPVRTVTVEKRDLGESIRLTGHIRARDDAALAFRIGGLMLDRPVNIGDRVEAGRTIAKLDQLDELNGLRSAQANLNNANGVLTRIHADFLRQQILVRQGHVTKARFDQAKQELQTAESQVKDAEAQLRIAQDRVGFTELKADAPGVITGIGAEPGEVIQAGRMVVRVARDGGLDAVFDFPANVLQAAGTATEISVSLPNDPSVKAVGTVREIAPQADPITRNFQVKVGLQNPPDAMRLGSTVTGTAVLNASSAIAIPASALTTFGDKPAVWVFDPLSSAVAIRTVEVQRDESASVVISHGLESGEIVVTAGVQALYPGRKVRLVGVSL